MNQFPTMVFCEKSYMLLEEITNTNGKLQFKSSKTGTVYDARPEDTMLASEEKSSVYTVTKFRNTLEVTAFDPTNPRVRLDKGCEKCGRKVVSYQRLSAEKKIFYACYCGNQYNN
jgi:DNA-directed RNA polymerase subunit M/transcription elongation factor TFIIS